MEHEHIDDNHSETEHEVEESESIDHYKGFPREKRSMSVDYEDEVVVVPFHNVPHYFKPIYTDTAQVEDTEVKDFLYSQQQHHSKENKKPYGYTDDKPGLEKPNSMETQPSEQEDYRVNHMEIKQQEALESMGHDHSGSGGEAQGMLDDERFALYFRRREDIALEHFVPSHEVDRFKNIENWGEYGDDDRRFHGHMRASRESHENTDERNGHETGAVYEVNENPDGSNQYTIRNLRGEDGVSESFGGDHDDGSGLVTRYRTHEEPEYGENGIPDSLTAIKGGESAIMSPGGLGDSGDDNEEYKRSEDNDGERRAFGGSLEETKVPESDGDGGETENNENNEDNKDAQYADDEDEFLDSGGSFEGTEASELDKNDENDKYKEVTEDDEDNGYFVDNEENKDNGDNEDVRGDKDEYEFENSAGNFEETGASGWDENDEDNENLQNYEDNEGAEVDKEGEDEFQDSGDNYEETESSDWEDDDEDYKGNVDNEKIEDYGDDEDDKDDDKEVEKGMSGSDFKITEASGYRDKYQTSRNDLKENAAAEWKEADKGDVEVSEGEAKTNVDIAYDASVSESKNYELVDDAAHARQASQSGYEYSKGVGGRHITEDYKH